MKMTVVVTGDEKINAALARLKGPQAKAAIRKASRTAMRPMLDAARRSQPRRTGRLARAFKLRSVKRSRTRIGSQVIVATEAARQAPPIEYGWTTRPSKTGGPAKRTKNKGQERLRTTAKSKESSVVAVYREETTKWIGELGKP